MLKQNKKDKQDRHRWLLIGFLCLFAVCLVAQVRPTEQKNEGNRNIYKIGCRHIQNNEEAAGE